MQKNKDLATNWARVYEAIHDRGQEALPEFEFRSTGAGWIAGNAVRLDGTTGKTAGKVYWYADRPASLHDFGGTGGAVTLWDYIARRDGLEEPRQVARRLFEMAGQLSAWDDTAAPPAKDEDAAAWDVLNAVCVSRLLHDTGPRAEAVRQYLKEKRNFAAMFTGDHQDKLGFYPGTEAARAAMLEAGADVEATAAVLASLPAGAGTTHPLTIAMHDHRGKLRGLQFRAIETEHEERKYLNPKGMDKAGAIYGTTRRAVAGRSVVVVEGILDAYAAALHGFANVAAIGGGRMTKGQLMALEELGPKDIYLALDGDDAGRRGALAAVEELLARPRGKVFCIDLAGHGAKDLDQLLCHTPDGADKYRRAMYTAKEAGAYLAAIAVAEVADMYGARLSDDVHRGEAAAVIAKYFILFGKHRAPEADRYLAATLEAEAVKLLGLKKGDILQYVAEVTAGAENSRLRASISHFMSEAGQIAKDVGTPPKKALKRLQDEFSKLEAEAEGRFGYDAGQPYGEAEFMADIMSLGQGLRTGFVFGDTEMILPPGVSVLAAGTGHGKTWALINAMLNAARLYPDKSFHFFSYEMARAEIAFRFLSAMHGPVAPRDNETVLQRYLQGDTGAISRSHAAALEASKTEFLGLCKAGRVRLHYPDADVDELARTIAECCKTESVGAVFLDYIQRVPVPASRRNMAKHLEIRDVVDRLKDVSVFCNIPVMAAAQFNRAGAQGIKSMAAENMADGADIERIASLLVGMHNGGRVADECDGVKVGPGELYFRALKTRRGGGGFSGKLPFCKHCGRIGGAVVNTVL